MISKLLYQNSPLYPEVRRFLKDRITRITVLFFLIITIIYNFQPSNGSQIFSQNLSAKWTPAINTSSEGISAPQSSDGVVDPLKPRSLVGKVHAVFGEPNPVYERALKLHEAHADARGHPMFVLRERILSGLWSKPAYILSVMLQELAKPEGQRLEWLLYVSCCEESGANTDLRTSDGSMRILWS
jgi:hypothetical protein